jgi:hypothetical protein
MAKGRDRRDPDDRGHQPQRRRARRKDTVHWCRGKVGVRHKPVIRIVNSGWLEKRGAHCRKVWPTDRKRYGRWWYGRGYICWHREVCDVEQGGCGKVLRHMIESEECPEWPHDCL